MEVCKEILEEAWESFKRDYFDFSHDSDSVKKFALDVIKKCQHESYEYLADCFCVYVAGYLSGGNKE